MRITYATDAMTGQPVGFDRGNSKEERTSASVFIQSRVRCRYTPESKARAKAFAKQG